MTVGSSVLHKAISSVWDTSQLDWEFKKYWAEAIRDNYPSLHDTEATPAQPFPYCVFEASPVEVINRMSGGGTSATIGRQIHDIPFVFNVFAKEVSHLDLTAKEVASNLVEVLIQKFGGHHTSAPENLTLDHGHYLISQYQSDYPVRVGDEEWQWIVSYIFRLDVPVYTG